MGLVLTVPELRERLRALQAEGKKIAFANGHFDLLHVGHLRYLRDARAEGDALVVATVRHLLQSGRLTWLGEARGRLGEVP